MGVRICVLLLLGLLAIPPASCGSASRRTGAANEFKPELKRAAINGAPIAYYRRGEGPPLLMLVGSHSTMSEWDPALLAELARGRNLILFDYPGVGLSGGKMEPSLTIGRLADTTADFVAALGLERIDVLGWSMGGMVAQQLAVRHPRTVRRLVLAATNPGGDRAVLGPPRFNSIEDDRHSSDRQQLATLFPPNRAGRLAARAFLARVDAAATRDEVPDDFYLPGAAFRAETNAEVRWLGNNENYVELPQVQVPTLVAAGGRDVLTPPANGRRIARRIRGAQLVTFAAGGHAFLFQFHRAFGRVVGQFLD